MTTRTRYDELGLNDMNTLQRTIQIVYVISLIKNKPPISGMKYL